MRTTTQRNTKRLLFEPLEAREVPATFVVTTTADVTDPNDHKLSMREAITKANEKPNADTIVLKSGIYQITLAEDKKDNPNGNVGGDFDILNPVTIRGASASKSF